MLQRGAVSWSIRFEHVRYKLFVNTQSKCVMIVFRGFTKMPEKNLIIPRSAVRVRLQPPIVASLTLVSEAFSLWPPHGRTRTLRVLASTYQTRHWRVFPA